MDRNLTDMTDQKPSPDSPTPRPRRRWLRVLLFVSLALNLAVAGLVGGAWLNIKHGGEDRPERISRELGLGPYLFAMDRDGRDALRKSAAGRQGDLRQNRSAWKQAFTDSLEVLRTDPFDPVRFRDLVVRQADLATANRGLGQDILVERVSELTPQERAELADRLEKGLQFGLQADGPGMRRDGQGPGPHHDGPGREPKDRKQN